MNKRFQKILALVLTLSLVLSMFTANMFISASTEELDIWDGNTAEPTATDNDGNILIGTPEELAYIVSTGGVAGTSYKLTSDIYLNDITKINWETGEVAEGYTAHSWYDSVPFNGGTIDGDGHIVYGMYFDNPEITSYRAHPNGVGLIPRLASGASLTVKNLGIENAYVNHDATAAGFLGTAMGGNTIAFSDCYAGETVTLKGGSAAAFRGYAYQQVTSTSITNCYSLATTTGTVYYGLVGSIYDSRPALTFTNCYNVAGPLGYGGNIGYYSVATNCYATAVSSNSSGGHAITTGVTVKTAEELKGSAMTLGDAYVETDTYPVLVAFTEICDHEYDNKYDLTCNICGAEKALEYWNGATLTEPSDSDSDGWIEINNGAELAYIIANGGGAGNQYILTNDIYLNDIDKVNWTTGVAADGYTANAWYDHGKTFQGTIDGDGNIVYGLYQNVTGTANGLYGCGLIPKVNASESVVIKNLGVEKSYIKSHSASAFVGVAGNSSSVTIDKCYVGESVTLIAGRDAGAFGGRLQGSIIVTDSYSLAIIEGGNSNGLLGDVWAKSTITNCYNAKGAISYGTNTSYFVTATNCYEITKSQSANGTHVMKTPTVITAEQMKGENTVMALGEAYAATETFPILKIFDRTVTECQHEYDDEYDPDCNLCGEEREVAEKPDCNHTYDDEYDPDCNICGEEREVPERPLGYEVWNGLRNTAPVDSDSDGIYEITNGEELAYAIYNGGGAGMKYILTNDIYLNNLTKINWETGEVAGGYTVNSWYQDKSFQGEIDGNGHVIYGMYFEGNPADYLAYHNGVGLVPVASGTVSIKNLGIDNAYIHNRTTAAAFVAAAPAGTTVIIDSCYAGENVTLKAGAAGVFRGFARTAYGGSVTNCYSLATTVGATYSGLIGEVWDDGYEIIVSNCFNANGGVTTHNHTSQVNSFDNYVTNNTGLTEGTTVITADMMKGIEAFENMPNLNANDKFIVTTGYPKLKAFVGYAGEDDESNKIVIWNGRHDTAPVDSDNDGIYEITNGEELAWVIATGNVSGYSYIITRDIYLNDITQVNWKTGVAEEGYTVNKWFDEYWNKNNTVMFAGGTIDGNGHVIYGLYWEGNPSSYDENNAGTGLIPVIAANAAATTIKNLGVDYAYMNHQRSASAFVGAQRDNTELYMDNCYAGANVTLKAADAGAFRGYARNTAGGAITNCYSLASVTGTVKHGLIAMIWDNVNLVIENCYNANGPVSSHNNPGNVASANNYESYDDNYDGSKNVLAEGVTSIYAAYMQGTDVFTNADKMPGMDNSKYVAVKDSYPELKSFWKLSTVKDGKNYIGKQYDDMIAYFANTADNSEYFFRYNKILVNGDGAMNICDLVYMTLMIEKNKNTADIDMDGSTTYDDAAILRKALIGSADYAEPFGAVTYKINNSNLSGVYTYVWGDEFDSDGLNSNNWSTETKMGGRDVLAVETTNQTTNVSGGNLTLTAYKDGEGNYHVPNSVHTKGTMNYKYGYVEIRAKLSQEVGSFASFWTRSVSDSSSPASLIAGTLDHYAEVDMFETFQKNGVQKVGGNILKNFPGQDKSWYATAMTNTQQYAFGDEEYHIYGYEWTPYEINLYIDGILYARLDITEIWDSTSTAGKGMDGWNTTARVDETETGMESFHEAQYLIFNHHLHYAGAFTASTSVTENESFSSADYVIDYCRVYQVQGQGEFASK